MEQRNRTRTLMLTALSLLTILGINAKYLVYKVKGDVKIKHSSKVMKAERRSEVKPSDYIVIPTGSQIKILKTDNQKVYVFDTPGTETLGSMIINADKKKKSTVKGTNLNLWRGLANNSLPGPSVPSRTGVSVHSTDAIIYGSMKVPDGMSYLQCLMGLTPEEGYDDSYDALFLRANMTDDEDTFGFAVFNTTAIPLYFNVIQAGIDKKPDPLFEVNPLAKPKGETIETQYQFAIPEKKTGYILVASTENFTPSDLRKLLDPSYQPEADYYFSAYFK